MSSSHPVIIRPAGINHLEDTTVDSLLDYSAMKNNHEPNGHVFITHHRCEIDLLMYVENQLKHEIHTSPGPYRAAEVNHLGDTFRAGLDNSLAQAVTLLPQSRAKTTVSTYTHESFALLLHLLGTTISIQHRSTA